MPASPSSNGEPDPSLSAESKRIGDQYNSLESRLVWDWLCGGNRHFGYYPDPSTWWPFPLGAAHLRMQGKLLETLNLPPGARVLDVGCGDGHVAIDLARRGRFRITAFDVVERHVENARRNVQLAGLEQQVTVLQLDFDRLAEAIPDASHDGIYTSETLIHAADVPRVLAEFRRVLVPGGRVVLHEYHNDFIGARIRGFTAEIARMEPPPSSSASGDDERNESENENEMAPGPAFARAEAYFKSAMAKAGFEDVVVRNYSPNIEPMAKLLSVSAWWRYIVQFFHLQRIFPKTAARTEGYVGQEHWDISIYDFPRTIDGLVPAAAVFAAVFPRSCLFKTKINSLYTMILTCPLYKPQGTPHDNNLALRTMAAIYMRLSSCIYTALENSGANLLTLLNHTQLNGPMPKSKP